VPVEPCRSSVVQGFLGFAGAWNLALLFVIGAGLTDCDADRLSARSSMVAAIGTAGVFAKGRDFGAWL
jgi:hypothetical protein